jgi:L-histidine Nalpha-methyltransferase
VGSAEEECRSITCKECYIDTISAHSYTDTSSDVIHVASISMTRTPLRLDVLLTELVLADRIQQSLDQRVLPEMFFYWFPLSVRTWVALCRDGKYRNYVRSDALIQAHARHIVGHLTGEQIDVISLGAGEGTKDLHVLEALFSGGHRVIYRPFDSGQMLLEMACEQALEHGMAAQGVKADINDPAHLSALEPGPHESPRLVMMIGNTLGAFDPVLMLRRLRRLLREGDVLMIDGELGHDETTRAGYEHPSNRAFALAPLRSIGLTDTDGTLMFHFCHDVMPGIHRLEKSFRLHEDRTLQVGGRPLHFKAGDCIHMNHSGKFERSAFLALLTQAGFGVIDEYVSEDGRFLMVAATPSP